MLVPPSVSPEISDPEAAPAPPPPLVKLVCFEVARYRRLRAVRIDLQDKTTVLVGANDSGKSSLMLAIQKFLAHATGRVSSGDAFSAYDLSADSWATLIELGRDWDQPAPDDAEITALQSKRQKQFDRFIREMPALDVWLEARDGAWHLVRGLIPSLEWAGGRVGLRLRLEPISSVAEMDQLIEAYRKARARIQPASTNGVAAAAPRRAWPSDLFDYLKQTPTWFSKVAAYKLDPTQICEPNDKGEASPQPLRESARPFESPPLRHIVRVDFIAAQRGLGSEEAGAASVGTAQKPANGLLSSQLVRYARGLLGRDSIAADELDRQRHGQVATALEKAHDLLDEAINAVLSDRIDEVRELGFPGLGDVRDIVLRTEVRPEQALRHESAVQYRSSAAADDAPHLPEHAIGLGYQNLLSLTFSLMRLRDDRLRPSANDERTAVAAPPPVHLVLLEEPEAHLHVQVQRTFVLRAHGRLAPLGHPELSTQLLVSTHSSHLAHAVDFECLRYLRRMPRETDRPLPTSVAVSLGGVFGSGEDATQETLAFVQRYLRVQHNDLLFADAVVLVEGTAERVLVPAFIERDHPALLRRYISLLDVGGSHAHRLKPFLEHLGLPTLVITDLDPAGTEVRRDKNGKERTTHPRRPTTAGPGLSSANPSIKALLGVASIESLLALSESAKVVSNGSTGTRIRLAYQIPLTAGEPCPSSLEDALVLENRSWFEALPDSVEGTLWKVHEATAAASTPRELAEGMHTMMGTSEFDKGEFALEIFTRINESLGAQKLACPRYVRDGLVWMTGQLDALDAMMGDGPR